MVNKERIAKLIIYLSRSKRYNQIDFNCCAIPLGVQHFCKVSERATREMEWEPLFARFQKYFGVSQEFCDELYGTSNEKKALDKLKELL